MIKYVSLNYIVIGENFSGDTQVPESSFLFARNAQMNHHRIMDNAINDFSEGAQPSPFSWDPTSTPEIYCGAIKQNSQWVLDP